MATKIKVPGTSLNYNGKEVFLVREIYNVSDMYGRIKNIISLKMVKANNEGSPITINLNNFNGVEMGYVNPEYVSWIEENKLGKQIVYYKDHSKIFDESGKYPLCIFSKEIYKHLLKEPVLE